ncbi:TPA: phage tail family protein [Bacillus cereus]|nr:phage tail family protein [Bacillus cereus]
MSLIIQRLNGVVLNTADFGLRLIEFDPESPNYDHRYEEVDGTDGLIDAGSTMKQRNLNARFNMVARDMYDVTLLRNEIFKLFHSKESFYIIDNREPGKRWLVKVHPYTISTLKYVKSSVELIFTSAKGLAESIGTTMDDFTFESGLWQIGQGLIAEDLIYKPTTTSFRIFNAGDVEIDPRKLPLVIRIRGATNGLTIKNRTTGDVFKLNIPTAAGDMVELNRVRVFKNGNTVFTSTNRKVIRLAPGWNDFIVSGTSGAFQIEFDFRFYYL